VSDTLDWMLQHGGEPAQVLPGAVPLLHLMGIVCGSWQMGRAALAATRGEGGGEDAAYRSGIVALARFWFGHLAPQAFAYAAAARAGSVVADFDAARL